MLARRRQLEAELAALEAHPGLQGYDVSAPPQAFPPADAHSRTSSSSSLILRLLPTRGTSVSVVLANAPQDIRNQTR